MFLTWKSWATAREGLICHRPTLSAGRCSGEIRLFIPARGNEEMSVCGSTRTQHIPSWRTTMNIRAMTLAGLLGLPLLAGAALAAETSNLSLAGAAQPGDRE